MNTIQVYITEINNLKTERIELGKNINRYLIDIADLKNKLIKSEVEANQNYVRTADKLHRRNLQIKDLKARVLELETFNNNFGDSRE